MTIIVVLGNVYVVKVNAYADVTTRHGQDMRNAAPSRWERLSRWLARILRLFLQMLPSVRLPFLQSLPFFVF